MQISKMLGGRDVTEDSLNRRRGGKGSRCGEQGSVGFRNMAGR